MADRAKENYGVPFVSKYKFYARVPRLIHKCTDLYTRTLTYTDNLTCIQVLSLIRKCTELYISALNMPRGVAAEGYCKARG